MNEQLTTGAGGGGAGDNGDNIIELSLPLNAAYLAAARLTASSIANRIGFDAEEIEDVKAAVSEACAFMIRRAAGKMGSFKITFGVTGSVMDIVLTSAQVTDVTDSDADMGLSVIRALMDEMSADASPDGVVIKLKKAHDLNVFRR